VIYRANKCQIRISRDKLTQELYPRFNCLPAIYVLIVTTHSLGGLRANRHHMSSPTKGHHKNQHKRGYTSHEQFTKVASHDLPKGICTRTPHDQLIKAGNNHHVPLYDPPSSEPARWLQSPRVTRFSPAQIAQLVPQDARPLSNALKVLQSHSQGINQGCKWVECVLLCSQGFLRCSQCLERRIHRKSYRPKLLKLVLSFLLVGLIEKLMLSALAILALRDERF
jgi:hypothetical protein